METKTEHGLKDWVICRNSSSVSEDLERLQNKLNQQKEKIKAWKEKQK